MAVTKLSQIMQSKKLSYRKLASNIKELYPESKMSKTMLQEMALGIKPILPHQVEILANILGVKLDDLI